MSKMKRLLQEERAKNAGKWWAPSPSGTAANERWDPSANGIDDFTNKSLNDNSTDTSSPRTSFNFSSLPNDVSNDAPKSSIFSTITANMQSLESDGNSISSIFAPKPPPPTISRNKAMLFNPDQYETYQEVMSLVIDEDRTQNKIKRMMKEKRVKQELMDAVQAWLLSDERVIEKYVVEERWKGLDTVWRNGWREGASTIFEAADTDHESEMLTELKTQQRLFMEQFIADNPSLVEVFAADFPDDDENLTQTKQAIEAQFNELSILLISFLLRYCAKRSRSDPMHVLWYKVKESGLKLPQDGISTFLYVVATMGSSFGSSMFRSSDEEVEEENIYLVPEEVATYHDLLCKPTEASVTLRIKTLAGKGETETAEELLEAFKKSIQDSNDEVLIRLRTYIPVFKNYCDAGNVPKALSVFDKMKNTDGVFLEPENYCMLLATLAENGCFR